MLPPEHPDRIHVAFDDHRLVANAGLILPATLAHHLGLGELVARHVDLRHYWRPNQPRPPKPSKLPSPSDQRPRPVCAGAAADA